jgi:hypothetical protein
VRALLAAVLPRRTRQVPPPPWPVADDDPEGARAYLDELAEHAGQRYKRQRGEPG